MQLPNAIVCASNMHSAHRTESVKHTDKKGFCFMRRSGTIRVVPSKLEAFIEAERLAAGETREAFEEKIGLARGHLSRWRNPGPRTLDKLARFFKRPASELRVMAATAVEGATVVEKTHRYPAVEERLAWARAKKLPQALIDMFEARASTVFRGEPSEVDVDAAWELSVRRYESFERVAPPKAKPKDAVFGEVGKRGK